MEKGKRSVKTLITISFITVILDVINNAIANPILPYLLKQLGSTTMIEGTVYSCYSIMQLISLLIMGPMSDRFGRRPFLLLSLFGSCFGSLFQGLSKDLTSFIIWRSFTGLFSGSLILVQAVVADLIPAENRGVYLTRLNACNTFSFVIGPAIGGILGQISYTFPLIVAGCISGVALVFAIFLLRESNPRIVDENGNRRLIIKNPITNSTNSTNSIKSNKPKRMIPKITGLMVLCFTSEFCLQWYGGMYNSRFSVYVGERWNVTSSVYATSIVIQSIILAFLQSIIYPILTTKWNIPLPILGIIGYSILFGCHFWIVLAPSSISTLIAAGCGWVGNFFLAPFSVSVISTSNRQDVQGTVLSWNNLFFQSSLIISPLILSLIYVWNRDMTFYLSSIFSLIGICLMIIMACRSDMKLLGKQATYEMKEKGDVENGEREEEKEKEKEVEMVGEAVIGEAMIVPMVIGESIESMQSMKPIEPIVVVVAL